MTRYALWEAARDLMEGRRRDLNGKTHGWLAGDWHTQTVDGSAPRECLNGAIALAEAQLAGEYPEDYARVRTLDGEAVRATLARTIREQYAEMIWDGIDDATTIAWFNDQMVGYDRIEGQEAMNRVLDETDRQLFADWLNEQDIAWPDVIEEADELDRLLPLA